MRKTLITLDKFEQHLLKEILTELVDKDSRFQLETLAEHACAVHEALKWLNAMNYTQPYKRINLQYWQLVIFWKIIYLYPADANQITAVRMLIAHVDKQFLTIQTALNYEVKPQIFQSNANLLR